MTEEQTKEIRRRLDEDLSLDEFERDYRSTGEAATQFFQDLFVQVLNFEETMSALGDATWQDIPVHEWPNTARANAARLFAEAGNFRVIYVELKNLTRTAERNAIQSLTRSDRTSGWAIDGSFLTVFHSPDEDIWHLVTPYEEGTDDITTGRHVLRRYTLGEGETHRTVANALSSMDASKGRLAERIDEAFRVKPVTEGFYENYKNAFDTITKELRRKGLETEDADRYAHVTLNRLMFFYYIQKKGWIGERKDFVRWFHEQYEESGDEDVFHEKWLSALFFDGMNQPEGKSTDTNLPSEVESAVTGLPYMNGGLFQPTDEDELDAFLSDAALNSVIRGFLEQYNFTITEESPYDIDVAVDPAMLGKIYESLIAEEERDEAGIFYTPRIEVDLMCRLSLYEQFCDHAKDLTAEHRRQIIRFIFSEPQNWDSEEAGQTEALEAILSDLRIVDPACGSGAFLVGMKQVILELYRKLGIEPDYELKEQVVNENLYGVDIKGWAVRVAEFRLWLSLIESADTIPETPVLPNFRYKLQVGDSIIQTIDDERVSLNSLERTVSGQTGDLIEELTNLKDRYFEGESGLWDDIQAKQREVLIQHIESRIEELENSTSQQTLTGGITEESEAEEAEIEQRIISLEETKAAVGEASDDDLFLWDLGFPEVMLNGGFDIVIGNPPYVPKGRINDVNESRSDYKSDLQAFVEDTYGESISGHSDLFVYFFYKGIDLLRPNGTLTFVTSNAWLSQNYGSDLQDSLLKHTSLKRVLDNQVQRTFSDADVNTVITNLNKTQNSGLDDSVSFISLDRSYESLVGLSTMDQMLSVDAPTDSVAYNGESFPVHREDEFHRYLIPEDALWRLGGGTILDSSSGQHNQLHNGDQVQPAGTYSNGNWGVFFRAPLIYFDILEKSENIEDAESVAAKIRRGITTGADDFFYLPLPGHSSKFFKSEFDDQTGDLQLYLKDEEIKTNFKEQGFTVTEPMFTIEREYVTTTIDDISDELVDSSLTFSANNQTYLPNIVLQSPEETSGVSLSPEEFNYLVLMAHGSKSSLQSGVQEYIEWGESWEPSRYSKYPNRNLVQGRGGNWYDLAQEKFTPDVVTSKRVDKRVIAAANEIRAYANQNVQCVNYDGPPSGIAAVMNSSLAWLSIEIVGNRGLGGGALEIGVSPLKRVKIPVPDENISAEEYRAALDDKDLSQSIYEQYGAKEPEEVTLETISPGRRAVDDLVLGQILGLSEDDQVKIAQELLRIVKNRIAKSEST